MLHHGDSMTRLGRDVVGVVQEDVVNGVDVVDVVGGGDAASWRFYETLRSTVWWGNGDAGDDNDYDNGGFNEDVSGHSDVLVTNTPIVLCSLLNAPSECFALEVGRLCLLCHILLQTPAWYGCHYHDGDDGEVGGIDDDVFDNDDNTGCDNQWGEKTALADGWF